VVWRIVVASLFFALKSVPDALQCSLQEMEAPVAVYHQSKSIISRLHNSLDKPV